MKELKSHGRDRRKLKFTIALRHILTATTKKKCFNWLRDIFCALLNIKNRPHEKIDEKMIMSHATIIITKKN